LLLLVLSALLHAAYYGFYRRSTDKQVFVCWFLLAALQVAKRLGKGARVVTVLPDSRDRYLSVEKYTT